MCQQRALLRTQSGRKRPHVARGRQIDNVWPRRLPPSGYRRDDAGRGQGRVSQAARGCIQVQTVSAVSLSAVLAHGSSSGMFSQDESRPTCTSSTLGAYARLRTSSPPPPPLQLPISSSLSRTNTSTRVLWFFAPPAASPRPHPGHRPRDGRRRPKA